MKDTGPSRLLPSAHRLLMFAKRLPLYQLWRAPLLRWLERHRKLDALANRLVGTGKPVSGAAGLSGGRHLSGSDLDHVPVVLIVCLQWTEQSFERLVDQVTVAQLLTGDFRPVFIVDNPMFGALRRHGYLFETLIDQSTWARFRDPADWPAYTHRRVTEVADLYDARSIIPLPPSDHRMVTAHLIWA